MKNWLALFVEHYRQPVSEISAVAYAEGLRGMSAEELDGACREALKTSEFMPTVATIRKALRNIRNTEVDNMSGYEWSKELEAERIERKLEFDRLVAEGKEIRWQPPEPKQKEFKIPQSLLTIEQQKEELRKRGYLR